MNPDRKDNTQIVLTNHELCSICQEQTKESLVNTGHSRFKKDSYNKLLENIHKRTKLGNSKYFGSSNRLRGIDENYFIENKLSWHSSYYKNLTNTKDVTREEINFQELGTAKRVKLSNEIDNAESCSIVVEPIQRPSVCTRTQLGKFFKEKCFFCQEDNDKLEFSACSSTDRGTKISYIVKNSNNDKWKANLAEVIS